jgi:hypothetical protein
MQGFQNVPYFRSEILYSFLSGEPANFRDFFSIDPKTGNITTNISPFLPFHCLEGGKEARSGHFWLTFKEH